MSGLVGVVAVVIAAPGALAALHLTVLTVASLFYREPAGANAPVLRFLVMVPARNEELVLAEALVALGAHRRVDDTVIVVADRCTDRTADIARQHGALVLERQEGDPPGRAASLRDGLAWAAERAWDAVVFIDADTIIEPGFFEACERVLGAGAGVAQARAESQPRSGALGAAALAASAMGGVVVPRGRDRLGGWVRLKGSGMILRREIAEQHPFAASGASEDGQLSLDLCLAGVVHRHVDSARIRYAPTTDVATASVQKLRYEAGRLYTARQYLPRLLRIRSRAALDAAIHLASPPLAVAVLLLLAGALLAWLAGWIVVSVAAAVLVALLAADVMVALIVARAGTRVWLSLLLAPPYVLWKGWIQARAVLGLGSAARPYEPTPRG